MKILQVCAYAAPYEGNFMKSLYAIENKCSEHGVTTIYAFPETAQEQPWCESLAKRKKVYFLPLAKARVKPKTYLSFARIYHENPDIEIVHSHFELYDFPAAITAPKTIKLFWHLHDAVVKRSGLHGLLDKIQYGRRWKNVTLISVSEKYRKDIVALGFPEHRTITLVNSIDLNRIVMKDNVDNIHIPYSFLAFCWDFHRKGCDIILQASKLLNESDIEFKVYLVGDSSTRAMINKYTGSECLPDYIQFFEKKENVNEFFQQADCFVSASRRETFSYAVCEAAYAGLQVISTDIPGLEWAHDLPTVHFFDNEDKVKLAGEMKESMLTPVNAQAVQNSRCVIKEKYGIENWAERVLMYYGII